MDVFRRQRVRGFVAAGLIFCLFLFSASLFASEKEECDRALTKCSVDAVIAGILSGPQTFLLFASGCLMGYTWCLKYYVA
jgi:hypothetical protein